MSQQKGVAYSPGQVVCLGDGMEIEGTVLAVMVSGPEAALSYKVAWWDGNTRTEVWVAACEVGHLAEHHPPKMIGFAIPEVA